MNNMSYETVVAKNKQIFSAVYMLYFVQTQ